MSLEKKSANNVIDGAKHAFGFTVLLRGVWTRKMHVYAMSGVEMMKVGVIKFFPVVTLKSLDVGVKLILYISTENDKLGDTSDLISKGYTHKK